MKELAHLWPRFGLPKSRRKKRKEATFRKRQLLLERLSPRLMLVADIQGDGQSGNGSTWLLDASGGVEPTSHLQAMGVGEGEGPLGDGPETEGGATTEGSGTARAHPLTVEKNDHILRDTVSIHLPNRASR